MAALEAVNHTGGSKSDNPLCCPDKKEAASLCSAGSRERRTHGNTKTFYGAAAVLSSHDSHDSQGKIQNKTHETFLERKSMKTKSITDASKPRRLTSSPLWSQRHIQKNLFDFPQKFYGVQTCLLNKHKQLCRS